MIVHELRVARWCHDPETNRYHVDVVLCGARDDRPDGRGGEVRYHMTSVFDRQEAPSWRRYLLQAALAQIRKMPEYRRKPDRVRPAATVQQVFCTSPNVLEMR